MNPQVRGVKIHREEMESLLTLKSKLDYEEAVSSYAAQYQTLGWVLKALNPRDGTLLPVDAQQYPEGLGYLEKLVAAAQVESNPAAGPEKVPWEALLDNARPQARESSAGRSEPAHFLGGNPGQSAQPERVLRPPFSCRDFKVNLRKI